VHCNFGHRNSGHDLAEQKMEYHHCCLIMSHKVLGLCCKIFDRLAMVNESMSKGSTPIINIGEMWKITKNLKGKVQDACTHSDH
jgi:hypothetical protein